MTVTKLCSSSAAFIEKTTNQNPSQQPKTPSPKFLFNSIPWIEQRNDTFGLSQHSPRNPTHRAMTESIPKQLASHMPWQCFLITKGGTPRKIDQYLLEPGVTSPGVNYAAKRKKRVVTIKKEGSAWSSSLIKFLFEGWLCWGLNLQIGVDMGM